MIDKQYNNKTIFAIKTKNNEVHYLQLSPDNYQQQFVQYLREKKIPRDDAYELKQLIQRSIREKAEEKRLLFLRQEQKIKNQLMEWEKKPIINKQTSLDQQIFNNNNPTQLDMKKQENIIDENNKNVLKQYCASPSDKNLLQNPINPILIQKSEYGVQVEIQINHRKENQNPTHSSNKNEQIKPEAQIQKINAIKQIIPNSFNEQMPKQFNLKMSFGQNKQQHNIQTSPLFNSPRFKQVDSQNQQVDQNNEIVTQQQIQPRKTPEMHSNDKFQSLYESFQKSTQANSPEAFNKSNTGKMKDKNQNKKIILLQNYKKSPIKNQLNTSKCSSSSSPLSKSSFSGKKNLKIVYNPQISKRLFENKTACFKNKHLQEFNTHQQRDYIEYLQYLEHVPRLIIHQFQDMSVKTTKSFRAKHQPQPNLKQLQEQQDYQRSFQEHLIEKRLERQRKQKLKKQKQGQHFQFKGPHCQQKIIREQMEKMRNLKEKKQKQIRERISKQIKQNKHKDLAERSCSPASLSRGCPCCKPVSPAKSKSKQQLHIMKANIGKSNKNNVKYISNVLLQAQKQFSQGYKQ